MVTNICKIPFRLFGKTKDEGEGYLLGEDTSGIGVIVECSDGQKNKSRADMSVL